MSTYHEQRLTLLQAAQRLGVHVSTIYRWCWRGVRGVRLESHVVGAVRYTSVEALERFAAACTAAADGTPAQVLTPRQRERVIATAKRELGIA